MHTATILNLDSARETRRSGLSAGGESAAGHERRSSLPPVPPLPEPQQPAPALEVEPTADLLLAMERHPLAETAVWVLRGADRRARVAVRVGTNLASAVLEPRLARFTADILIDEQAFVGCLSVAERLHAAADRAEALNRPLEQAPVLRSSHLTLIGFGVVAGLLIAAALADAVSAWLRA